MALRSQETRRISFEGDALRLSMNWTREDLAKPQVLVESTRGDSHPSSHHLGELTAEVAKGVLEAGGMPADYTTTDICDGVAQAHPGMRYSLMHREMLAGMVEIHAIATPFDAVVLSSAGDKAVPGHLMALARLGLPGVFVPGGAMALGPDQHTNDELWHMHVAVERGEMSQQEFEGYQAAVCPGCGACQYMGTAATMQVLSEALGLALPGSALVPATNAEIRRRARQAGRQVVALLERGITVRDILTPAAFENAIVVHAAVGGSLNAVMHLIAIAREVGIRLRPEQMDAIHRQVPVLADTKSAGNFSTELFWYAGGVPQVMAQLTDLLHLDVLTVTGHTLRDNLQAWAESKSRKFMHAFLANYKVKPDEVIRPRQQPVSEGGSLAVLKGNLAPEGATVKKSAVVPEMQQFTGRARVFRVESDAVKAIVERQISPGDVVVIINQGPRAAGMPEMFFPSELMASDLVLSVTTALLTDGRFSGATKGPCIGYVSPEAVAGGPIGLVEEGDLIRIDIPERRLDLVGVAGTELPPAEIDRVLAERRSRWQPPQAPRSRGILGVYQRLVGSAMAGAVMAEDDEAGGAGDGPAGT